MNVSKDLVGASVTPVILSVLAQEESYGYDILLKIRVLSDAKIEWTPGMLYPVLHRLERQGLVESAWRVAEGGRKRKYYRIKTSGRAALRRQREEWRAVDGVLGKLWGA